MMKKPELLSPAGSLEKLQYAVTYGADAVYLAGLEFGMRRAAENFDGPALLSGIQYAHARGRKVYVTVNTLPRASETARLPAFLEQVAQAGANGLIVADVGVLALAKKHAPGMELHISTQASVTNHVSAAAWHDLGATRIILARELSLDEIAQIRAKTPSSLQLEVFVHGAMCMAYSGRCLLSSYFLGRDANRGACAQPCRWNYALMEERRPGEYLPVFEDDTGSYILNATDLCMIEHIPDLMRAGVDSFKIEGRVKTAYYVACVTNAYRRAVDLYMQAPDRFVLPDELRREVERISHRPYGTGFFYGQAGQHAKDSDYIRPWDIAAVVCSCDENRQAHLIQKNRFFKGEQLELLIPGCPAVPFAALDLRDGDGHPIDQTPHPHMQLRLTLPVCAPPMSVVRRRTAGES